MIRNANLEPIAETSMVSKVENAVEFSDMNRIKIAAFRRKKGLLSKKWKVNLFGKFDRRLLIFLPMVLGK